jgi:hypothetical protein
MLVLLPLASSPEIPRPYSNNEAPAVLLLLLSNEASFLVFSSFFYDVGLFLPLFFLFLSIKVLAASLQTQTQRERERERERELAAISFR